MSFHADPIPPGIVRVTVCFGQRLYIADIEADRVDELLDAFERHVHLYSHVDLAALRGTLRGSEVTSSVAARVAAMHDDPTMAEVVPMAGLWKAIYHGELRDDLEFLIREDAGAWCLCGTDPNGIEWTYAIEPRGMAQYGEAAMPWVCRAQDETVH